MRAVGVVVGARRDQLDRVGAEDGQVADVLLPHRDGPAVVGVGLGPVAELMTAQSRVPASSTGARARRQADGAAVEAQLAQQAADAEEHAALVGAGHRDVRRVAAGAAGNLKALRAGRRQSLRRRRRAAAGSVPESRRR